MKLTYDGAEYSICFNHDQPEHRSTSCAIFKDRILQCGGYCRRNPTDRFVREIGRKLSLTRALLMIKDKCLRRAIWECYLDRVIDQANRKNAKHAG